MAEQSILLECDIKSLDGFEKDAASLKALSIPEVSKRQPDLLYMIDVMVSTGGNLNSAYFMPSEIYKARSSIVGKAVDILHNEEQVVGHITGYAFLDKTGNPFDIDKLKETSGDQFDNQSFDVATSSVIYKMRFPEIADRIESRHFKVSMECFYRNIDIKVGSLIISAEEAMKAGLIEMVGGKVQIVDGSKKDIVPVYRVLRDIHFSGKGLVDKPANPDSLILEAAALKQKNLSQERVPIINLLDIESYRKMKQEKEKIEILSTAKETAIGLGRLGPLTTINKPENENLCVSFARHAVPGDDSDRSYEDAPPQETGNYCKLFGLGCPVGGMSSDYACWRNVFNRTMKDDIQNEIDALLSLREKLGIADGPSEDTIDKEESSLSIEKAIQDADEYLKKNSERIELSFEIEEGADSLPDSAYAYVERGPGGKKHGYLPHHNSKGGGTSNVNLDLPHLRNAFARVGQVKPHYGKISKEALVAKCEAHLNHHRSALKGDKKDSK